MPFSDCGGSPVTVETFGPIEETSRLKAFYFAPVHTDAVAMDNENQFLSVQQGLGPDASQMVTEMQKKYQCIYRKDAH